MKRRKRINWWFFLNERGEAGAGDGGDGGDGGGGDGGSDAGGNGGSKKVNVDHGDPNPPPQYKAPELDMKTAIPPDFRNKPYFQKITSFEQLVKEFDNVQHLIGKRPSVIPGPDARPEERARFYEALRPKDAKEYEFPETEYSKKFGVNEPAREKMREVFHKLGLDKTQVSGLAEAYDAMAMEARTAEDAMLDERLEKMFPGKRDEALDTARNLMKEHIPQDLRPLLAQVSGASLLLLTTTLNSVYKKYISQDAMPSSQSSGTGGAADVDALRQEAHTLMKSPEFKDFRNAGHDRAQARVKEIYKQIDLALRGAKK